MRRHGRCTWTPALGALIAAMAAPGGAWAHLERPSYWPDPAPDSSVSPPAGGAVPTARTLASAVSDKGPGTVRVVCQGPRGRLSMGLAKRSIAEARTQGFKLRPSQPTIRYTRAQAKRLLRLNERLRAMCRYDSVQRAINVSQNNDRVVIMPGVYTEPESRRKPLNDPACNPRLLQRDASGDPTPSYAYQVTCPNDQNLIYVQGRAVKGQPVVPPRENRQGIPEQELGPCVRCNLQIEGSGAKPEDVILDAGERYEGSGPEAKPHGHAKHVVLRVDRADGFVGRNMLLRGGLEFGFYTEETDGVLLEQVKLYWNADYGHLSFTSDHHVVRDCDAMGAGDAAIYPGAAPETGAQATDFYPDAPRANTVITRCDMRNSALGYSGSMGNAVRITDNHVYGNATGIASDTLSSAGHPGFPADSVEIDHNYIYANNFNVYGPKSVVKPLVGVPVGAGIIFAGMNDARVHDNWFFDNWRFGAMLLAVPDALTSYGGGEGDVHPGVSCAGAPDNGLSTSCGNDYFNNRLGQVPAGFQFPEPLDRYRVAHGAPTRSALPNGVDFWWDEFLSNRWNCWYGNTGPDGSAGSVTGSGEAGRMPGLPPNPLPDCNAGTSQDSSVGMGDVAKELYLIDCASGPDEDTGPLACDWWSDPPRPGGAGARRRAREVAAASRRFSLTPKARELRQKMEALAAGALR
jgi:hypothetical protein